MKIRSARLRSTVSYYSSTSRRLALRCPDSGNCLRAGLLVLAIFVGALPVEAQEIPRISYVTLERSVWAESFPGDRDNEIWTNQGRVARVARSSFANEVGSGSAMASHRSDVTDLSISATFESRYSGSAGFSSFRFSGENNLTTAFQVTSLMVGELRGEADLTGTGGARVTIALSPGNITLEYGEDEINAGPIEIIRAVTFEPGVLYVLGVHVEAEGSIFDESAEGTAILRLALKVGDEDEDGLADVWEENNGINVDNDPELEIDFSRLGINLDPTRKDLIVEVDAHSGSTFPLNILSEVVNVFKTAPVSNPDGSQGINLHLLIDEQNLPSRAYSNAALRAEIAAQKQQFYGTVNERGGADWEAIKRFRLRSIRYAVIGGAREDGGSGWGEIPGDDFIVTTDEFTSLQSNIDYAGTFMHELGHTLGLDHGGADPLNFKPNYLSVMNYLFMMKSYLENTIPWSLDYSHSQLATLDENWLSELGGFGDEIAAGASTHTLINVAGSGLAPDIRPVPVLAGQPVDFNGNGMIDTDPDSVDVNHFQVPGASPGQRLRGYDDWSSITLAFVGSINFGDGIGEGGGPVDELNPQDYEALRQMYASVPSVVARESNPDVPAGAGLSISTWPNPARMQTNVRYDVPTPGFVRLAAYDLLGRRVATIVDEYQTPGRYTVPWEPYFSQTDVKLAAGVYLIRITLDAANGPQHDVHPLVVAR